MSKTVGKWAVFQADCGELVRVAVERSSAELMLYDPCALHGWAVFALKEEGDGKVSLRAGNGRFLCAELGGGTLVLANREAAGSWEKFTREVDADGLVSLKADNGKFLRAIGGGGDVVLADGDGRSEDEATFYLTTWSQDGATKATLRTRGGHYLVVERVDGGRLVANRDAVRDSQTFAVDDVAGASGKVSLKASNGKYVCDDRARGNQVVADRGEVNEWERFTLSHPSTATSRVQASSGRYVAPGYGRGNGLYADRQSAGLSETFTDVPGWERPRPKKLLVYYGWPSTINGAADLDRAAAYYACYEYVVLGRRIEEPGHADRSNTVRIVSRVAELSKGATQIFGYVPLGKATKDETMADGKTPDRRFGQQYDSQQIAERIRLWKEIGVSGVLLDEFGFDHSNDRKRQNDAVEAAHEAGLWVIANAWNPDDAFERRDDLDTALEASDFYLCESWQLKSDETDGYAKQDDWKTKAEKVRKYQQAKQLRVLSVTTTRQTTFKASDLTYAWYSALLYGHEAFGWGEATFSGEPPMKDTAPLRSRPALCPHSFTATGVSVNGTRFSRATDRGVVWIDTASHTGGVQ